MQCLKAVVFEDTGVVCFVNIVKFLALGVEVMKEKVMKDTTQT